MTSCLRCPQSAQSTFCLHIITRSTRCTKAMMLRNKPMITILHVACGAKSLLCASILAVVILEEESARGCPGTAFLCRSIDAERHQCPDHADRIMAVLDLDGMASQYSIRQSMQYGLTTRSRRLLSSLQVVFAAMLHLNRHEHMDNAPQILWKTCLNQTHMHRLGERGEGKEERGWGGGGGGGGRFVGSCCQKQAGGHLAHLLLQSPPGPLRWSLSGQ